MSGADCWCWPKGKRMTDAQAEQMSRMPPGHGPRGDAPKRIVYTVQWNKKHGGWDIFIRGKSIARWAYEVKANAIAFITKRARNQWKNERIKSQVLICDRNDDYQSERTYPDDTRRRKS